jgi:hypothetical protein
MKRLPFSLLPGRAVVACTLVAVVATLPLQAQPKKKNPTSKVYFSDVSGEALIDTGDAIEDLAKRTVYNAEGTVIETKRPQTETDRSKYYSTMVYSNGTGAFFDADTRVEVRRFMQEPFLPNRNDGDVEPSISQTQAFVSRGTVGLCTSKLVAGSNMVYATSHASVNIRGRKVVIEAGSDVTKISMLEGDSTVKSGPNDLGGHIVHAGEQAIIRKMPAGQPNQIQIERIPDSESKQLDDKVAMACMAKKTVYFEVREKSNSSSGTGEEGSGVTAFDGSGGGGGSTTTTREIVPVEVVPTTLPVEFTVSPARLTTPGNGPGGE